MTKTTISESLRDGSVSNTGTGDQVGTVVLWGGWKVRVGFEAFEELATKHNLTSFLPLRPTAEKAFRRAVEGSVNGREGVTVSPVPARDGVSKSEEITYSVQRRRADKDLQRVDRPHCARITWLPALNKVITDRPSDPAVQRIIASLPEFRDNYITDDLHAVVDGVLRATKAISFTYAVGRGTNSRFVPVSGKDLLDRLIAFVEELPDAEMLPIEIFDATAGMGTCQKAAKGDLGAVTSKYEAELTALRTALDEAAKGEAEADGGRGGARGPRESTIKALVEKTQDLRDQVDLYASVLRFRADDLDGRLDAVMASAKELLGI